MADSVSDSISVRLARERYFAQNGFAADGDYSARWIWLKFGVVSVPLYNSKSRQRAVPLHDLHHIATGFATDPRGEAQVAIWELASGTKDKWFAFFINLAALAYGFVLWPRDARAAWRLGARSQNLYGREFGEDLLDLSVGELKALCAEQATT